MLLEKIKPLISALTLLVTVYSGHADLLFKPGEPYVNYAFEGYRAYESLIFGRTRAPQFDNLGQFVMNGVSVFELKEYRTIDPVSGSIITQINTGEPKELEFGSEKSIHTKVLILTARVSADINLENLDTKNFDIVDLRE